MKLQRLIRRSFMTFWKEISFRSYSQSALMKILIPTISMRTMQPAPLQRQLRQRKLAFLSDIEGVYRDKDDPSTLISELRVDEAENLISDGTVGGGMIPKLKNCIDAIEHGVNRVHILDGRIPHSLLLEIFTNKGIGTAILREDGEEYYHEHE